MQSGQGATKHWVLEFAPESRAEPDPLMGWTGSSDMRSQVRLKFPSKEEAVAHAERLGIAYRVIEPKVHRRHPKSYANNFRPDRKIPWTH